MSFIEVLTGVNDMFRLRCDFYRERRKTSGREGKNLAFIFFNNNKLPHLKRFPRPNMLVL